MARLLGANPFPAAKAHLRTLLVVCGCAAAVILAAWAGAKLERFARGNPAVQLSWEAIHVTEQPLWIAVPVKQRALENSTLPKRLSILEPHTARQVAAAFALEPWVREVKAVRIYREPSCVVELTYREPVALVAFRRELIPVDAEGVVLPAREVTTLQPYPRVVIGGAAEPPAPGTAWENVQVKAAARLAEFLAPHQAALRIAVIEASRYRGDEPPTGPLELLTRAGSRVIWGRPPGTSYSGELSAEIKLQRLLDYVEQFGSLDAPSGPYEIDVTRWTGMTRRKPGTSPWRPADPSVR